MRNKAGEASSAEALQESKDAISELSDLIEDLVEHNAAMRAELAALSFMTIVSAADSEGLDGGYERLGGARGVRQAVMMLYERVMGDPTLAPFFSGMDMLRIRQQQAAMFLAIFGVNDYMGRGLGHVHEHLGITHAHFDRLISHVEAVLKARGLNEDDIEIFTDRLYTFEDDIVRGVES